MLRSSGHFYFFLIFSIWIFRFFYPLFNVRPRSFLQKYFSRSFSRFFNIYMYVYFLPSYFISFVHSDRKLQREYFDEIIFPISVCFFFQYFVFDFHMSPVMLFDKIITLSVSGLLNFFLKHSHSYEVAIYRKLGSCLLH